MLAVEITVVYTYFTRIYIIVTVPCVLPGEILSVEDGPGQQQENSIVKITEIVRFLIRLKTISLFGRPYRIVDYLLLAGLV